LSHSGARGPAFRGRSILVTGTSRGLGRALATALAAEGAHVLCHARRTADARAVARAVGGAPVAGDLATSAGVAAVAEQAAALAPALHVLVHNAAVNPAPREAIDELAPGTFREVLAVNVEAAVFLTTALLGPLRAAGGAQVLAVSSEAGVFSNGMGPTGLSYRVSKAALNAFVVVAAQALAADGIRVNAVHPGWIRTDMGGTAAPLSAEQAARDVVAVLTRDGATSGRLFQAGVETDW
jgi:NAD(P)-dependent dehydrogenase (short-subunit alcohol dehydrogenase family)